MSKIVRQQALISVPHIHHSLAPPRWLMHLGALGVFSIAVIDSSIIPLPIPGSTDLLLLWLVAHGGDSWLLALSAIGGSLLGGYSTWQVGRKGGESTLRRYVPVRFLGRIVKWVERHPILSVLLPAVLPPPIPLTPFVLAAGALGVSRNRFLAAYGTARCLRYGFIAWLAAFYGRKVVRLWSGTLQRWSVPLLWTFGGLLAAGVCIGIWKLHRIRQSDVELESKETASAD